MTYLEYLQKLGAEQPDKLSLLFSVEVDANGILVAEDVVKVEPPEANDGYSELEAAYAKNRALREHIRKMQEGRNGWHLKAEQADKRIAKLLAQRDEYKLLAEAYKSERDVLRDENLKMAGTIAAIREQLEDDGR